MSEQRVSIGTLKAQLSEYLRRTHAGETVIVTDRGRPVARLAPLEREDALEGRMAGLVRAGLIQPPKRPLDLSILDAARPADPEGRSLEAVLEERTEGW